MINSIIFPAPNPPSYSADRMTGEILYVPTNYKQKILNDEYVPCLYLPYQQGSPKLLIVFHGNAEDLGISYEMMDHLRHQLHINVLAMEYPRYGIYTESVLGHSVPEPNERKIFEDVSSVIQFVVDQNPGMKMTDIIVLGRSLGSGAACYASSNFRVGGLILMSPFTSIRNVAWGKVGLLSYLISDQFNNLSRIGKVTCPTFILHGQKDTLIPIEHARSLERTCGGPTSMVAPPEMTHNDFDF